MSTRRGSAGEAARADERLMWEECLDEARRARPLDTLPRGLSCSLGEARGEVEELQGQPLEACQVEAVIASSVHICISLTPGLSMSSHPSGRTISSR